MVVMWAGAPAAPAHRPQCTRGVTTGSRRAPPPGRYQSGVPDSDVSLNDAQARVLRWIADGCPPGVMEGYAHRVSASALRSRELVRIFGKGKTWRAELTDRGRDLLERLDREPSARPTVEEVEPVAPAAQPAPASGEDSAGVAARRRLSKTEQLVADVIEAGGRLLLPDETGRGGVNWRQRAYAAQRHSKVPAGKHLSVSWTNTGFEIVLRDGETGNELGADEVPVPARLTKYHRVAQEFRDRTGLHEVSREALPRVLRIMHALAKEAERREYEVACVRVREDSYGRSEWKPSKDGQLVFTINGHDLKVRIWEKGSGLRGPYERQKKRWKEDRQQPVRLMRFVERPKPYDAGATGELNIEVLGWSERQSTWGDRKRWTLEDRLPQLMRELETQAAEAEERRLARERDEAERQRQWEAAMERAKRRLTEDHRIEVLRQRVHAWHEADAIRAYCDAVEARYGTDAIAVDPEAAQWLALAREHANRAQQLPRMPADPDITHEALKPYLGGWSPYGPRGW
jgi:hypothetical protein